MVDCQKIERIIAEKPNFSSLVFQKGFLISSKFIAVTDTVFCRNWRRLQLGPYYVWLHPNTDFYTFDKDGKIFFLIGHAYNPVRMICSENDILQRFACSFEKGAEDYQRSVDELTGVFVTGVIDGTVIRFQSDAVSMYASYVGMIKDNFFLTSHCNLLACVEQLSRDPFVDDLVSYKYYPYFGASLPGDLSPFLELKRVQANFEYTYNGHQVSFRRIFPCDRIQGGSHEELIESISTLLENNMSLIMQKWGDDAALGLTGGRDSTTALAGAHAILPRLRTFSYVSCEGEQYDASAAEEIAKAVRVSHVTYPIELSASEMADCDDVGSIIEFNMGSIGGIREKDIRKRVYFFYHPKFRVEIKSWVDEIGRARLHKRYLKRSFPKQIRPRYLTVFYKVFGVNRILVHKTDKAFSDYLRKYYSDGVFGLVPWWDLIYWEYLWGSNEALHLLNEHMVSGIVTIPFNNRTILKNMLRVALSERIKDSIQIDVIERLLPEINRTGVHVKDFGWNRKRELSERLYWEVQTKLPF